MAFDNNPLSRRRLIRQIATLTGILSLTAVADFDSLAVAAPTALPPASEDLVGLVNCLQGTNSDFGFSRGNTCPLSAGRSGWRTGPRRAATAMAGSSIRRRSRCRGAVAPSAQPVDGRLRQYHLHGAGGEAAYAPADRASRYKAEEFEAHPHVFSVRLQRDDTRIEMAPTERCAVFRFTFAGKSYSAAESAGRKRIHAPGAFPDPREYRLDLYAQWPRDPDPGSCQRPAYRIYA